MYPAYVGPLHPPRDHSPVGVGKAELFILSLALVTSLILSVVMSAHHLVKNIYKPCKSPSPIVRPHTNALDIFLMMKLIMLDFG